MRYSVNVATSLWKEIRLLQQRSGIPDPLASKKYSGPDPCQWLMMLQLSGTLCVGTVRNVHGHGCEGCVMGVLHQSTPNTHLLPHSNAHCPTCTPRSSQCTQVPSQRTEATFPCPGQAGCLLTVELYLSLSGTIRLIPTCNLICARMLVQHRRLCAFVAPSISSTL